MTFLTPLLMVALIMVPLLLSTVKSGKTRLIAVNDESGQYVSRLQDSKSWQFVAIGEDISSLPAEKREDFYAWLSIRGNLADSTGQVRIYATRQIPMELSSEIRSQLEKMASEDKISSYRIPELAQILKEVYPTVRTENILWSDKADGQEVKTSSEISMVIGMVATMLIYIFIFAYGSMVMNGVVEEKSSRIVEIIVSSVKPFQLMMGKIVGIALVGLTQFILWVLLILLLSAVGLSAVGLPMDTLMSANLPQAGETMNVNLSQEALDGIQIIQSFNWTSLIIWFILFFLGGYLLYASLFAAIGGAVDNNEDSQQFTLAITIPVILALYIGIYGAMNPDGPLVFWSSFIPFFSPIVMMVRLPMGVPFWQIVLSFALLVITFLLCVKLAAKIYRTGILMYGKKVTYKDLWKWIRYKS
ncbi:MAG: ABC transporter permease [Bacteroidales bacterium]|nr:ABC transporter permease [Bacteroidales bacterium]